MHQKRLTDRLTSYWDLLRKDQPIPEFSKFNNASIADVWDHCMLFSVNPVSEGKASYTFYRMGDKVKALYGGDLSGSTLNPKQSMFKGAAVIKRIDQILEKPEPMSDQGQFINDNSKVIKYRSCLLPFGGNDGNVTHIIVGLSWREF